jgi:hypothetical protein
MNRPTKRLLTLAASALLLRSSLCVSAQTSTEWPAQLKDRRVRLRGPGIAEGTLVGEVVATEIDTLILMPEDGGPARRVPLAEDVRVQVSRTTSTRVKRGLIKGALIGGLAYGVPSALVIHLVDEPPYPRDRTWYMVGNVAAGALVGAAIGVTLHLIGDSWEPARPPARFNLLLAPTGDHGWRAAVALRF